MSRRGLQGALLAMSAVATVAGARGITRGAAEVVDPGPISANIDSEYRFYATWYLIVGALLFKAARDPQQEPTIIRAAATGFFVAACSRALSARSLGPPHRSQRILMWIELAIPVVIIPWHRSLKKTVAQ